MLMFVACVRGHHHTNYCNKITYIVGNLHVRYGPDKPAATLLALTWALLQR